MFFAFCILIYLENLRKIGVKLISWWMGVLTQIPWDPVSGWWPHAFNLVTPGRLRTCFLHARPGCKPSRTAWPTPLSPLPWNTFTMGVWEAVWLLVTRRPHDMMNKRTALGMKETNVLVPVRTLLAHASRQVSSNLCPHFLIYQYGNDNLPYQVDFNKMIFESTF